MERLDRHFLSDSWKELATVHMQCAVTEFRMSCINVYRMLHLSILMDKFYASCAAFDDCCHQQFCSHWSFCWCCHDWTMATPHCMVCPAIRSTDCSQSWWYGILEFNVPLERRCSIGPFSMEVRACHSTAPWPSLATSAWMDRV